MTYSEGAALYYTVTEVAALYRVNPKTVRRWIADGRFPGAVQAGGNRSTWRIPATALQDGAA